MTLQSSNTSLVREDRFRASIIAQSGKGKTMLCATLSKFMPPGPVTFPLKSPVSLDDTQWILTDGGAEHGGLDSLKAAGVHVDYFDLSNSVGLSLHNELLEAAAACKKLALEKKKTTFVFDSVSVADKVLLSYFRTLVEAMPAVKAEKFNYYDSLLAAHMRIFMAFRSIPGNVLFVFHEKYLADAVSPEEEAKRRAEGQKSNTADLDLSGRIRSMYVNSGSYIVTLKNIEGAGGKVERFIETDSKDVFTKVRTQKLASREPADLRMLVAKLNS